jgi:type IV pilus assembly protein PilY1
MRSRKVEATLKRLGVAAVSAMLGLGSANAVGQTMDLADKPLFSTNNVPGNLMLTLSVEWPTASTPAYLSTVAYANSSKYLGYFDPAKCYRYVQNTTDAAQSYFAPQAAVSGSGTCVSTSATHQWSGNYLNWAAMQSLDIFRWALTGGDRMVDSATETILEKTRHSGQGGTGNYPDKTLSSGVSTITPFASSSLTSSVSGQGTFVRFSPSDSAVSCTFSVNSNRAASITCTPFGGTAMSCNTANNSPAAGGSAACTPATVPTGQTMACAVTRSSSGSGSGNRYNYSCSVTAPAVSPAAGACASTSNVNYSTSTNSAGPNTCTTTGSDSADYAGAGTLMAGRMYRAQMRVKACDSAVGLESNCKQYGTVYKPEGLMQEYAMQLRFGAFGYLNDGNLVRDGGVLRAQINSIGPQTPVPGSTPVANTVAEWSASTGQLISNPDTTSASQTTADATSAGYAVTVGNSGVINYLNKFGKLTTDDYKGYDPVSEMYYAATRYFRNQGNVPEYTNLNGAGSQANLARWIDGFPVIRQWTDPMQYSCQKNFILGIGDVYAWADKNLPGSTESFRTTRAGWASGQDSEPSMPSTVSGDTAVNVTTATNMVGQLEGLSNLATQFGRDGNGTNRANSNFLAGLAYEAHTRDIRPESTMPGVQTISTYWMDVRESQTYESKNQYWLAAKYGGFDVPTAFDPYATTNGTSTLTSTMWTKPGQTVGADSRPNNYFIASDLRDAFARISSENEAASTTSFSTTTAKVSRTGTASYATQYNPRDWSGDVEASEITFNQFGVPELTTRWRAGALLDAAAPSSRKIVTCCTSAGAALPFRATDLAGATLNSRTNYGSFTNVPGVSGTQTASNYVDYLRGVRTMAAVPVCRPLQPRLQQLQDPPRRPQDGGVRRRQRRHAACVWRHLAGVGHLSDGW